MRKFKFHVTYSVWDFSKWNISFFLGYNMITSILGTLMKKKEHNGWVGWHIEPTQTSLTISLYCYFITFLILLHFTPLYIKTNWVDHVNQTDWVIVLTESTKNWSISNLIYYLIYRWVSLLKQTGFERDLVTMRIANPHGQDIFVTKSSKVSLKVCQHQTLVKERF